MQAVYLSHQALCDVIEALKRGPVRAGHPFGTGHFISSSISS